MKSLIFLTLALCLIISSAAFASPQLGLRAGVTVNPDQFHFGGHLDLGQVLPPLRLVPNVEFGFGNNLTFIAMNGDLLYDFQDTPWSVGGELGLNFVDSDYGHSHSDLGLSALGNYRLRLDSGKTLLLEAKLGLVDSPDFKFTVGWNF
jgi:hypothetical protein